MKIYKTIWEDLFSDKETMAKEFDIPISTLKGINILYALPKDKS
jgi:hypothetical protein